MKLIDLHKQWMESGLLPEGGLCNCLCSTYAKTFEMLKPTDNDFDGIYKTRTSIMYWGCGITWDELDKLGANARTIYSELRQTIVLLICAIHDEL